MDKLDRADKARTPRRLSHTFSSLGSAMIALFMLGAITFGANYIRPMTGDSAGNDQTATVPGDDKPDADGTKDGEGDSHEWVDTKEGNGDGEGDDHDFRPKPEDKPDATPKPKDEPADEPDATPKPEEKPDATPKPKPEEKPAPEQTTLSLEAWVKEGKVKLAWSKYGGDAFEYYKLVRSEDVTVGWPLTWGDELVAAISDRYSPYAVDGAPCGTEFHYRVFAVKHAEEGYRVLAASNTVGAFVECHEPAPAPEPSHMGMELSQTDEGVALSWEQCTSDGFVYYKVVRSATNESPMYPLNDGSQLLAAIGDPGVTSFTDHDVAAGQTWFYRVLSFAMVGDDKVLVGLTDALAITLE